MGRRRRRIRPGWTVNNAPVSNFSVHSARIFCRSRVTVSAFSPSMRIRMTDGPDAPDNARSLIKSMPQQTPGLAGYLPLPTPEIHETDRPGLDTGQEAPVLSAQSSAGCELWASRSSGPDLSKFVQVSCFFRLHSQRQLPRNRLLHYSGIGGQVEQPGIIWLFQRHQQVHRAKPGDVPAGPGPAPVQPQVHRPLPRRCA